MIKNVCTVTFSNIVLITLVLVNLSWPTLISRNVNMYFSFLVYIHLSLSAQLIVAVEPEEIPRLEGLMERGLQNGVKDLKMVDAEGIREIEPNCVVRHCC